MKKIIHYLQIFLMLILIALPLIGFAFSDVQALPTCDYKVCPGGNQFCCTQGGVTLYNRAL